MSVASETQAREKGTQTSTWEFDPAHSSAEFAVRHLMVSTVTGRFKSLRGSLALDETSIEKSQAEAEIDAEAARMRSRSMSYRGGSPGSL